MYLHLGGETVVKTSEVIAILNLDNILTSSSSREYLKSVELHKEIQGVHQDEAKTIVITTDKVYKSPISSLTLMKRANSLGDYSK